MSWTAELDAAVGTLIARVAQEAIAPRYRQLADDDVTAKAADDVVTVADTHAERLLSEGLAALLPKATIVGEEAAHADPALLDRLGDGLCWIIDPLDGTNNFAAGKPPFGVLIALAEHGECVAGWIYDVLSGRLCTAQKGRGAFVNGMPVRAQATGQVPPVAAISTVFMDMAQREAMRQHILPHYSVVDIPRCAAEQYPRLVLGVNDVSIFERTLAWDHAAGVLFVNEAGGKAARPDGRPYRVDQVGQKGLVAASSPVLFDAMAERLAAL
ncbi:MULTISPECIES: inositol monophosphatase family protein [unclassified Novosphingobium]|uniref:inositol monophosphatase family protein n=1 Tax=unclassified Novosphingobium TaxID=2644732 RepID=UPI00146BF349|nr:MULTISPECIES: inositol monophosphatase family protein [unclassified Novosphingobium]NMN04060.1 fructose-1,6-bisphosphatase/inositol monophosphatase family enzyme [Novosphingobium sp. SG919]NMN85950.1 fructose-1,6-bisphosphatase/inositol monophosphatase family enzyme [Novosphingobium sp. SG916]